MHAAPHEKLLARRFPRALGRSCSTGCPQEDDTKTDIGKVSPLECLLEDMDLLIQLSVLLPLGGYLSHGMQHRRVIPTAK